MLHSSLRRLCSWQHHRGGDNHHVGIFLPTFAVQFLIAEARGLSFGFLGPFEFQGVLFCVRHLYVLPQSFFLHDALLFHSSFLSLALKLLFLSRTSPCFPCSSTLLVAEETDPAEF